jgi:hypothetical protein
MHDLKGRIDEAFYDFLVVPGFIRLWHGGRHDFRNGARFAKGRRLDAEEITPPGAWCFLFLSAVF